MVMVIIVVGLVLVRDQTQLLLHRPVVALTLNCRPQVRNGICSLEGLVFKSGGFFVQHIATLPEDCRPSALAFHPSKKPTSVVPEAEQVLGGTCRLVWPQAFGLLSLDWTLGNRNVLVSNIPM